uniref:Reverse transcriptase domain-containing protein n=1 Tax=Tanacetum cinerariifolium TaxID=118510 RepID=A0A6L2LQW7_TANCI|nr:hypothetical protein [Tanacetum cinerariifolium]
MHNDIMAASSRDRPPTLAMGRCAQLQSRFLRYIDTRPNGDALRKCILEGDPKRDVLVNETFHVQIDDELAKKELK